MDVVLLPAWHRGAFLLATLKLLLRADYSEDHLYLFQLDHGDNSRRRDCHSAATSSNFSRCFNRDRVRASAK